MNRNSSIELLRIISIFFIVMMHICALLDYDNSLLSNKLFLIIVNSTGNIGVSCFVFISGYYGVNFKIRKFVYLVSISLLYIWFVELLIGRYDNLLKYVVQSLPACKMWFISCYMILMLLSKYLNKFAETLTAIEYKKMLMISCVIFCVVPMLFKTGDNNVILHFGGKNLSYFMFLYLIGRYIKLHHDVNYKSWKLIMTHISATLIIFCLNVLSRLVLEKENMVYSYDCSPFILISALSVFYYFKHFVYSCRVINYIASSVLAFYLLNNIYLFFDKYVHLTSYSNSSNFIIYTFELLFFVWLSSIVIDKTVGQILSKVVIYITQRMKGYLLSNKNTAFIRYLLE